MLQEGVDLRTWIWEGLGGELRWWRDVAGWPDAQQEWWAERAAMVEVEGGVSRHEAEYLAWVLARGGA
jgi:hypothetical protein